MTWLNNIIGQGIASQIGACGATALQQSAQQAMANRAAQQQQAYQVGLLGQMSQGQMNYGGFTPPKWMINGIYMTVEEFANTIWPTDVPDKTFFLLKYSGETK
jgi:hypothetical protein